MNGMTIWCVSVGVVALLIGVCMSVLFLSPGVSLAQTELRTGQAAPDFTVLKGKEGKPDGKLSDFRDRRNVLVAFFPKAFTPGCTKQMCGYRDTFSEFKGAETEVVAVSMDSQVKVDEFKEKYQLPFLVVGDPDGKIVDAFGVAKIDVGPVKAAKRSVFLVDKSGKVRYIDRSYSVTDGYAPLRDAMRKLEEEEKQQETK